MTETLFNKYGGFSTINKIVLEFYDRVLESEILAPYFDGIDMKVMIRHQTMFLSQLLGGPAQYNGRTLQAAHAKLSITEEAFAEVAMLLEEVLGDAGMEPEDVATVMGVVASVKDHVVSKVA